MALGSAQPLTEMSTRDISWGGRKGGWRLAAIHTIHLGFNNNLLMLYWELIFSVLLSIVW
jgi:hypothetical protein